MYQFCYRYVRTLFVLKHQVRVSTHNFHVNYYYVFLKGYRPGIVGAIVKLVVGYGQIVFPAFGLPKPTFEDIYDMLGQLSPQFADGEFGFFKGKNATKLKNYYTINNGRYQHYKFNKVELFNGESSLPQNWWIDVGPTPSANDSGVKGICHDIYGTDGTMFPPFVESETTLWIFVAELCRSIWLEYTEDVEVSIIFTIYVGAFYKQIAKILRSVVFTLNC